MLVYAALIFGPTSSDLYRQAQYLLVHYRIPQHAIVSGWWRWTVYAQLTLLLGSCLVIRKTRLFSVVSVAAGGMILLTAIQAFTGSDTLALLFPWRLSVILVPLASTILLAAGICWAGTRLRAPSPRIIRWFTILCMAALAGLVAIGVTRMWMDLAASGDSSENALTYIREHAHPDDIFLVPPRIETFRLDTGIPAFVDLKSIPYRDTDVLEWYRRLQLANQFYETEGDVCAQSQAISRAEGVTVFLLPSKIANRACPAWQVEYSDADFSVMRVLPLEARS
jgi:hypothetical protein